LLAPKVARASDEVEVALLMHYEITKEGVAQVRLEVETENLVTEKHVGGVKLGFLGISPEQARAFEDGEEVEVRVWGEDGVTMMELDFEKAAVGKGKQKAVEIFYEDRTLVDRVGEVWEVTLPQITDPESYAGLEVELGVPFQFGELAYISPEARRREEKGVMRFFYFGREQVAGGTINLAFGEFQVYAFNLVYHLENPVKQEMELEIAIPPDTAWQKVMYEAIAPEPINVRIDEDGNWLAKYVLGARARVDVNVLGKVQVFAEPRELGQESKNLESYLQPRDFWETESPEIMRVARELRTARGVYDWVVEKLSYDYERVKPNAKRLGAVGALARPEEAMCLEFTDLFVALARAAGIPAREVNGYAYTENAVLQPLSLVADVLHSWPEYWDSERGVWVQVDPTWGDTTGGENFFEKLDLRHFAFVIHGMDSEEPYPPGSYKLGANPQKDVYVSFGNLPEDRKSKAEIAIEKLPSMSLLEQRYGLKIINPGPSGLYNLKLEYYFDEVLAGEREIVALPAYGSWEEELVVPSGVLGLGLPNELVVRVDGREARRSTNKSAVVLPGITLVLLTILILAIVAVRVLRKNEEAD